MKRDYVIRQVADAVGTRHSVDLTNYDLLILVDIYRVPWLNLLEPLLSNMMSANIKSESVGDECGW